jgi:hypothetical protein
MVARSTSGFTEVATRGPDHSRIAGMTQADVLKLAVGPKTRTEWQSSAASSRLMPGRPGVRPRMTRPGLGPATVSSRSSRPRAHSAPCWPARVCSRPGRWPGARPGRCRATAVVPPAALPTTVVAVAYMPTGPGSAAWVWVGQARAGSFQWCGSCHKMLATSAGARWSQVWPNTRPASCPVDQTSSPAVPVPSSP